MRNQRNYSSVSRELEEMGDEALAILRNPPIKWKPTFLIKKHYLVLARIQY